MPERKFSFWVRFVAPFIWPLRCDGEVVQHKLASDRNQVDHHVGNAGVFGEVLDVAAIDEYQVEWRQPRETVLPAISNHRRPIICTEKVESSANPMVVDLDRHQARRGIHARE